MWRKLFKVFGAKVVVTTDYDGEMRWRFAFKDPRGGYRARAIIGWVVLNEDGTCTTEAHLYVKRWQAV